MKLGLYLTMSRPDIPLPKPHAMNLLRTAPTHPDSKSAHEPYDILLIIEVADSSIEYDRTFKASLYAEANIFCYWTFNVLDTQLEVLEQPFQKANGEFAYRSQQIYSKNQNVTLPSPLVRTLDLTQILP